jgi:signal transduction histidine kinase
VKARRREEEVTRRREEEVTRTPAVSESTFDELALDSKVFAAISHEMRTPLTAICGFLEMMADSDLTERQARWVALASTAGAHLRGLVDSVQSLSGFEPGGRELALEAVDIDALVYESSALIQPIASSQQIEVSIDHDAGTPLVAYADRNRLRQVFLNLLSNAIKFGPPDTAVMVTTRRVGSAARVEVRDEGEGIEPALADRLFTPFDRLDAGEHGTTGLGLGLALSRGLMQVMGGTLEFVPSPGPGTLFRVELPSPRLPESGPGRGS